MRSLATLLVALPAAALLCLPALTQQAAPGKKAAKAPLYNTAKQKLLEAKAAHAGQPELTAIIEEQER